MKALVYGMHRKGADVAVYRIDCRARNCDEVHNYKNVTPSSAARVSRAMERGVNCMEEPLVAFVSVAFRDFHSGQLLIGRDAPDDEEE